MNQALVSAWTRFGAKPLWALLAVLLVFPLGLLGVRGQAQESAEIVLYRGEHIDTTTNTDVRGQVDFISLDDGSVRTVELPSSLFQPDYHVNRTLISPDHRYLVIAAQPTGSDGAYPTTILNLETGSCCITVPLPIEDVAALVLGSFNPEGTQFSLSWLGYLNRETYEVTGGMMTVDAATGQVVNQISSDAVNAVVGEQFSGVWSYLGSWEDDGIRFVQNCYACEGVFEGEWSIWNPDTNTFTVASGEYFSVFFADVLPATGEILYATQNAAYPASPMPSYLPIPNVITYIHNQPMPRYYEPSDAPVIYADPTQVDLSGGAHWVLDGEAALIIPNESTAWVLLYRDGTQQTVTVPAGSSFVAGTPRGWLSLNNEPGGKVLTLYTVDGGAPVGVAVGEPLGPSEYVDVLDAPALGAALTQVTAVPHTPEVFPALTAPEMTPVPVAESCPTLTPTRLSLNINGQVTPGMANNLRSEPGTSAPLIGTIPGGGQFYVLNGPVCDEAAGVVWWQVQYGSQIGWTAESQNGTYFVEPMGVG